MKPPFNRHPSVKVVFSLYSYNLTFMPMKYVSFILTAFILFSCTKDKLEKETKIFEGTWNWDHSVRYYLDASGTNIITETINSTDYPDSYSLTFEQKGKVYYKKNNNEEEKYRIVFNEFKSGQCAMIDCYSYEILLNNKPNNVLSGSINADTLITSDTNIPLTKGNEDYPYFEHVYLKN